VQKAVCAAYLQSRFYWGAVTLLFRLAMSIVFTNIRDIPSTAALIQCFLCVTIIMLLMHQKPYCHAATNVFDVFCHAILVVQFGLVVIGTVSDSLGFVPGKDNIYFDTLNRAAEATLYLRYQPRFFSSNFCTIVSICSLRFVPFIVGAMLWIYLHRAAIYDNTSLIRRPLKGLAMACFNRFTFRRQARTAEHGNSVPLL
jgi:hypothetical protein